MFQDTAEDQFFDSNNLHDALSDKQQNLQSRDRSQVAQNWLNDEEESEQELEEENELNRENLNYEPGLQNFETEDRETHKRNIPTPYSEPVNEEEMAPNVINAYIPSFANNSLNLKRLPFKSHLSNQEVYTPAKKPHEFSIRLDPRSLGLESQDHSNSKM